MVILPPAVKRENLAEGYLTYLVNEEYCKARIARHGGHVMEWMPKGQTEPVLYLSPQALFSEGKPIRGGIPVCWPWFNAHPSDPEKPSHGLARNRFWTVTDVSEHRDDVFLELSLNDDEETRAIWPHAFELKLALTIGETLKLNLTAKNLSDKPIEVTGALHSYFRVGDIGQTHFSGLEGVSYLDTVGGKNEEVSAGSTLIKEEVDRIYHGGGEISIHDGANNRVIKLTSKGSNSTVIWNPWVDKSKAIGDLPDEDYKQFLCVETANAAKDVVTIAPGKSHTLGVLIEVL